MDTDFIKLYEKLSSLNNNTYITEKWESLSGGKRIWFSSSEVAFRKFMQARKEDKSIKGLRLLIAPGFYLIGRASDYTHDTLLEAAEAELFLDAPNELESLTCGIPKCLDFELDNCEITSSDYDAAGYYHEELIAKKGIYENLYQYQFKNL